MSNLNKEDIVGKFSSIPRYAHVRTLWVLFAGSIIISTILSSLILWFFVLRPSSGIVSTLATVSVTSTVTETVAIATTQIPIPATTQAPTAFATSTPLPTDVATALQTPTLVPICDFSAYPSALVFDHQIGGVTISTNDMLTGDITWFYVNNGGCELTNFVTTPSGNSLIMFKGDISKNNGRGEALEKNDLLLPSEMLVIVQNVTLAANQVSPIRILSLIDNKSKETIKLPLTKFTMPKAAGDEIIISPATVPMIPGTPSIAPVLTCNSADYPDAVKIIGEPTPSLPETSDDPNVGPSMVAVAYILTNTGGCELKILDIKDEKKQSRLFDKDRIIIVEGNTEFLKQYKDTFSWMPNQTITIKNYVYYNTPTTVSRFLLLSLSPDGIDILIQIAKDYSIPE